MSNRFTADSHENSKEYRDWPHDITSLRNLGEEILEEWEKENLSSPRDYPPVRWLEENGCAHLRWILSEKHDMGTPEFFVLFTSAGGSKGYEWNIDDVATIERAEAYLEDRVECRNWSDSTKRTNRSRLNGVFGRFVEQYGDDAIIAIANDPSVQPQVYDTFKEVVKDLRRECASDDSAYNYLRDTHRYFEWLDRAGRIVYDPMAGLEDEFRWDWSSKASPLKDEQVKKLWLVAKTDEERMIVIGYCVWGVRTKELPEVHIDQLRFDEQDPKIRFEERHRKNGQGEVTLIFGLDALARLLDKRSQQPDWNGYLYPPEKPERSFLEASKARDKFKELARRANVKVDGKLATPKHGRSFYYNVIASADTDLLQRCRVMAEKQGAVDGATVRDDYLNESQRQRYIRTFFRDRIRQVLPSDAYTSNGEDPGFDGSIDRFE